jgi:hypothetical protein
MSEVHQLPVCVACWIRGDANHKVNVQRKQIAFTFTAGGNYPTGISLLITHNIYFPLSISPVIFLDTLPLGFNKVVPTEPHK